MRSTYLAPLLSALALLLACGGKGTPTGPWLTDPGVSGHAAFLPLATTVHDPSAAGSTITCNDCHGQYDTFKKFDCSTSRCHLSADTDPIHIGIVTGYPQPPATPTSADCYHCHPGGTGTFPDHPKFFPIGTGTSHALGCTQCHTKFDLASRRDPSTLACATCHDQLAGFSTKHASVKDFVDTSAGCVRCHADGQVDRVAAHAPFPVASGSTTHDTACTTCHDAYRTDKPAGADFTVYDCLGCHAQPQTDANHPSSLVSGYVYASTACYGCHPNGTGAPANHPQLFPIDSASAHAGVGCSACHGANNVASPVPANFLCASCHQGLANWATAHSVAGYGILIVHTSQNATQPVAATSDQCLKCHADSQVTRASSHPQIDGGFAPGAGGSDAAHAAGGCLTCHTALRTDKPFPATNFSSANGCATCHPNGIPH